MGIAVKISDECVSLSASTPTKQAWARYARRRWPENAVAHVQMEWDLSPGRARGLVYANATQATIDDIRAHPRGGLMVCLTVEAMALETSLEDLLSRFIEHQRSRIDAEAQRLEADRQTADRLARRLASLGRVHPGDDRGPDIGRDG